MSSFDIIWEMCEDSTEEEGPGKAVFRCLRCGGSVEFSCEEIHQCPYCDLAMVLAGDSARMTRLYPNEPLSMTEHFIGPDDPQYPALPTGSIWF